MTDPWWQNLTVFLIVGASVIHLVRVFRDQAKNESGGSCGKCATHVSGEVELVQIESASS